MPDSPRGQLERVLVKSEGFGGYMLIDRRYFLCSTGVLAAMACLIHEDPRRAEWTCHPKFPQFHPLTSFPSWPRQIHSQYD